MTQIELTYLECPDCGHQNSSSRKTCRKCHNNLLTPENSHRNPLDRLRYFLRGRTLDDTSYVEPPEAPKNQTPAITKVLLILTQLFAAVVYLPILLASQDWFVRMFFLICSLFSLIIAALAWRSFRKGKFGQALIMTGLVLLPIILGILAAVLFTILFMLAFDYTG